MTSLVPRFVGFIPRDSLVLLVMNGNRPVVTARTDLDPRLEETIRQVLSNGRVHAGPDVQLIAVIWSAGEDKQSVAALAVAAVGEGA